MCMGLTVPRNKNKLPVGQNFEWNGKLFWVGSPEEWPPRRWNLAGSPMSVRIWVGAVILPIFYWYSLPRYNSSLPSPQACLSLLVDLTLLQPSLEANWLEMFNITIDSRAQYILPSASWKRLPNISSAWRDNVDNCLEKRGCSDLHLQCST